MSDKMTLVKLGKMRDQLIVDLEDRLLRFNRESGTCVVEVAVETVEVTSSKGDTNPHLKGLTVKSMIPSPYVEPEK